MTKFNVGDEVTVRGVIVDVDPSDKKEMYAVSFRSNDPNYETSVWFCEADLAPAAQEPEQIVAPELSADDMAQLGIEPGWKDANRRQTALHMAVELGKAVVSGGGHADSETLVKIAGAFERYMRGEQE